jgi:DNA-binding transcriptional MerR regulator
MVRIFFPGTVIERTDKNPNEFLFSIFSVTKGLMLAQVKEITGLDTSAIQNWVNRGWVQKPINKRYTIDHLARILIINMLRDVMKFENIAQLLIYINGETEDLEDNIISESRLYCYVCEILDKADFETILSEGELRKVITKTISDYTEPFEGARNRLIISLEIILLYYACAIVKYHANKIFDESINKFKI